jgi:hypothetical protein
LTAEQIRIGSWWAAADGGKYGCVVLSVNLKTKDATVLGTDGKQREIDTFKLQYRYGHCIPNDTKLSEGSETLKQESASSVTRTELRYSALIARLRYLLKTMRTNATSCKSGEGFANPELQSERNASAHSVEFWAQRIEEELMAEMNESEESAFKYNEA